MLVFSQVKTPAVARGDQRDVGQRGRRQNSAIDTEVPLPGDFVFVVQVHARYRSPHERPPSRNRRSHRVLSPPGCYTLLPLISTGEFRRLLGFRIVAVGFREATGGF